MYASNKQGQKASCFSCMNKLDSLIILDCGHHLCLKCGGQNLVQQHTQSQNNSYRRANSFEGKTLFSACCPECKQISIINTDLEKVDEEDGLDQMKATFQNNQMQEFPELEESKKQEVQEEEEEEGEGDDDDDDDDDEEFQFQKVPDKEDELQNSEYIQELRWENQQANFKLKKELCSEDSSLMNQGVHKANDAQQQGIKDKQLKNKQRDNESNLSLKMNIQQTNILSRDNNLNKNNNLIKSSNQANMPSKQIINGSIVTPHYYPQHAKNSVSRFKSNSEKARHLIKQQNLQSSAEGLQKQSSRKAFNSVYNEDSNPQYIKQKIIGNNGINNYNLSNESGGSNGFNKNTSQVSNSIMQGQRIQHDTENVINNSQSIFMHSPNINNNSQINYENHDINQSCHTGQGGLALEELGFSPNGQKEGNSDQDEYNLNNKNLDINTQMDEWNEARERALMCKEHKEVVQLYCQDDRQLLCVNCLYSNEKHKRHRVIPLKRSIDLIKKENSLFKLEAKEKLQLIDNSYRTCSSNRELLKERYPIIIENISKEFSYIYFALKEREQYLQLLITNIFEERIREYDSMISDLSYLKSCIQEYKDCDKHTENLIQNMNSQNKSNQNNQLSANVNVYVFSIYSMIRNTLKNIDLYFKPISKQHLNQLLDFDSAKSSLLESIDKLGRITNDLNIRDPTTTFDNHPALPPKINKNTSLSTSASKNNLQPAFNAVQHQYFNENNSSSLHQQSQQQQQQQSINLNNAPSTQIRASFSTKKSQNNIPESHDQLPFHYQTPFLNNQFQQQNSLHQNSNQINPSSLSRHQSPDPTQKQAVTNYLQMPSNINQEYQVISPNFINNLGENISQAMQQQRQTHQSFLQIDQHSPSQHSQQPYSPKGKQKNQISQTHYNNSSTFHQPSIVKQISSEKLNQPGQVNQSYQQQVTVNSKLQIKKQSPQGKDISQCQTPPQERNMNDLVKNLLNVNYSTLLEEKFNKRSKSSQKKHLQKQ